MKSFGTSLYSKQTPAKAPHEKLVMGVIAVWFVLLAALRFYGLHVDTHSLSGGKNEISPFVIGCVATLNKLVASTLSFGQKGAIACIFQSLVASTLNSALSFSYGIAPQVADPFIWGPRALELFFAAMQFTLCAIFPRTKESEDKAKRFSISSLLVSPSTSQRSRRLLCIGDFGIRLAMEYFCVEFAME